MAANLQVISGRIQPNKAEGSLRIEFSETNGAPFGDATLVELNGAGRDFRSAPHAIISLSNATISTFDNSFYRVDRKPEPERLTITWKINATPSGQQMGGVRQFGEIDFLVIGVPRS
jgi:hypothetical protein